jgi:single-stranded-DNA-specific exonuclease
VLALELEALNARRQLLTRQVLEAALQQIQRDPGLLDPPVLILAHPEWPAGVIGIVASQLAERYHRPIVMLANPPGQDARGSARSIEGVDITACIAAQSALLNGFGGHPMAAGMSLPAENLPAFRRGLARSVQAAIQSGGGLPPQTLGIDAFLELDQVGLDLVSELERLAPFGAGNPALVFAAHGLTLASSAAIGRTREHLQMIVSDPEGQTRKLVWWGGAGWPQPPEGGRFDLAYSLRASNYRGQPEIQVEWIDFRPLEEQVVDIRHTQPELVDLRAAPHPKPLLDELKSQPGVLVWAEGEAREQAGGEERSRLGPAPTLVIWSIPPGRSELLAVLEQVRPLKVIVFGFEPGPNTPDAFIQRLAALVKFSLRSGENRTGIQIERLAGACAQRAAAAQKGLAYLEARGLIAGLSVEDNLATFMEGSGAQSGDPAVFLGQVKALLRETAEYRRYFKSAPLAALF